MYNRSSWLENTRSRLVGKKRETVINDFHFFSALVVDLKFIIIHSLMTRNCHEITVKAFHLFTS